MAKLVMVEEEEGKPTKIAHSMVAKDGEVIACPASLFLIFSCQGRSFPRALPPDRPGGSLAQQADGLHATNYQVLNNNFLDRILTINCQGLFCSLCQDV